MKYLLLLGLLYGCSNDVNEVCNYQSLDHEIVCEDVDVSTNIAEGCLAKTTQTPGTFMIYNATNMFKVCNGEVKFDEE